jgi:hypothetical protein
MPGRIRPVTWAPLLAVVGILAGAATASAHRLNAEYRVLPEKKVQVEAWFDITGDAPVGATVQVFGADKRQVAEGKMDEKGTYLFSFDRAEPLTVVVSAGMGHGKELTISAAELAQAGADARPAPAGGGPIQGPTPDSPRTAHQGGLPVKDVLLGVAFLLAVAAFFLSLRNARELRRLRERDIGGREERG